MTAVIAEQLHISFHHERVLEEINLRFPANKLSVLAGHSGSGKTTFLRALNRLHDEVPGFSLRGRLALNLDGDWHEPYRDKGSAVALRRKVGMVFQVPNPLPMSIRRNLLLPLELVRRPAYREREGLMEQALRAAQLWDEVKDRLDAPAASLSGGQQQRLCLARALLLKPQILLLDEPTVSLDHKATEKIESLLAELKQRCTLIMVSHDPAQVTRLADHVVRFEQGRVVAQG